MLVTCKNKQHFNILASSLHDMFNNTDTHTRSAAARDTKDRFVRLHLPSTVKNQFGRKHHQMTICQWNVRILLDRETTNTPERRTALVAMELAKYNIDIAVLSKARFHASGSLNDLEYTFYWSGKPNGERREAGVGFAINRDIVAKLTEMPHPVSDRIMTMRIPLTKDRNPTIVSAYAPIMRTPRRIRRHCTVSKMVHSETCPVPTSSC